MGLLISPVSPPVSGAWDRAHLIPLGINDVDAPDLPASVAFESKLGACFALIADAFNFDVS
jgi:hypothetical protein